MAALVAAIHEHPSSKEFMGGRDKPGHDDWEWFKPEGLWSVKLVLRSACLVLAAGLGIAAAPAPLPPLTLTYTLTPKIANGTATALDVTIAFHADGRGTLTF